MNTSTPSKILIVQERIPHYRIALFDRLGQEEHLDVTVLHSGKPTASPDRLYHEIIVNQRALGMLRYQDRVMELSQAFDLVILMFDMRYVSTLRLLLNSGRVPVILWGIGLGQREWVNKLRMAVMNKAKGLILYDGAVIPRFVEKGFPEERIFVASNTVHVNHTVDWSTPRQHFLFVGVFKERKRVQDLLSAFYCARHELPEYIHVNIVGSGDQRPELEAQAAELGIADRISFLGKITENEKLAPLFASAIAYVSPGHVGLSVLQSFAYGVPVVTMKETFHGPEANNMQDGVNSLLYDGSIEQLKDKLIYLANNSDVALQLGKNAYEYYSENRTIDKMSAGFTDAIEYVLST